MSFLSWMRGILSPAKLLDDDPVVAAQPLHEQIRRIGGGLTPNDVSVIMAQADSGQPQRLVDLGNESRQKDGHFQGVCGTRDRAVALFDLDFQEPEDATPEDKAATKLCKRIVQDFKNWPDLVEHLGGSYFPGHATAEITWRTTRDLLIVPHVARPLHARNFIFSRDSGALRYAARPGDQVGVDLLAENPGRIVQLQRRIVGDVGAREGAARVLIWLALFRNWDLRDLITLGEIAWKPWRVGSYEPGTHQKYITALMNAITRMGATGVAVIPNNTKIDVQWPGGVGNMIGTGHINLFELLGREMSKAVLGQTTTTESTENGDQRGASVRDKVRGDIREQDCRAVAAALYWHMFMPAVAINIGDAARCPVPFFNTDEGQDQLKFAQAMKAMAEAGVRIGQPWVREQVGAPEPKDGEECIGVRMLTGIDGGKPDGDGTDGDEEEEIDVEIEDEDKAA